MKARRGDLSGPVLAILVTLVLLAIGAAIIAYFVLLGASPQQGVVAVVGQPTIVKAGSNDFIANITIKNAGSATIFLRPRPGDPTPRVYLNITGTTVPVNYTSKSFLFPGETATIGFVVGGKWRALKGEYARGVLIIRDFGNMEVVFRVVRG